MTARTRRGCWLTVAYATWWVAAYFLPLTHSHRWLIDLATGTASVILSLPLAGITPVVTSSDIWSGMPYPTALLIAANSLLRGQMASAVCEHVRSTSERGRLASLRQARACPTCGYDLRVTPDRCPECGNAPVWVALRHEADNAVRPGVSQSSADDADSRRLSRG